jgi:PAS domain S-box-containing protein
MDARTAGFRASPWTQVASFVTRQGQSGSVEVVYLEERPEAAEGPFLLEERSLIQSLADMLRAHVERKHTEQALKKAEQRFSSVFMAAPVGIVITRADGCRVMDVNHEFERLLGYTREEALGRTTLELGLWPDPALRDVYLARSASPGGLVGFEAPIRVKDGRVLPLRISAQVLQLDGESFLLSAFVDLSEQKRAEASIRESEGRLRRVIESPILGFAFGGSDGLVHEANDEYLRIVGRTRADVAAGRVGFEAFAAPESRQSGAANRESAAVFKSKEVELTRADGSRVPVLLGVSKLDDTGDRAVAFVFDLTERRALERQLQQAQRMEAIGRLAAGIAHDFNNVLSAITLSSELLLEDLTPAHPSAENVAEIRKAADRAAALTRQLLAFSRQQVLEPRVIDLQDLVQDLENMLRRVLGEDVALETRYAASLGAVRADPAQIEQVILNLAVNARDAMPEGGTLTIETSNVAHEVPADVGPETLPEGPYVVLAVTDDGIGMGSQTKARMFEPFFTTKEAGKGTGLGLAMVYGIVKQSGGGIEVASEPGNGACFRIFLPRVDEAVEAAPATKGLTAIRGKETILLVEDDPWVRLMTRKILARLGYRILEAASPKEARELAAVYAGPIDVLLTDLVMPGTSGRALATELVALRPKLRVLLMSGYTDDTLIRRGSMPPGFAFVPKPFKSSELAQRLRAVLDPGQG